MESLAVGRGPALLGLVGAAILAFATGCATTAGPGPRARPPAGPVEASAIDDDHFAESVHTLLHDGNPTAARQALLAGVVRRQLAHAAERLKSRQRERGVSSVVGALYLIRAGELRPEMLDATSDQAITLALDVIAATGDEGRSQALYELRRLGLAAGSPARRDAEEHLAALDRWITETQDKEGVGPTEKAGGAERRLTARALLLPTDDALKDATAGASRWVDAGISFQEKFRVRGGEGRPKREEAVEGFRAVTSGAATLAALYLRHGDAAGAVEAINGSSVERVAPPGLVQRLAMAARPREVGAWRDLLELFGRPDQKDEEISVDRNLLAAATFGIAVEAYRRDPTAIDVSMALASGLGSYGMVEAAPTVLAEAAEKHPDAPVVSAMLEAVGRAIAREEHEDDPGSARRTFAAASRLLAVADRPALKGKLNPSPSRVRLLAASIDAHAGELASARTSLTLSLRDEPGVEARRLLADVERGLGNGPAALELLREVATSPEARKDRLLEAEARLTAADLHRELGARDKAREELNAALPAILEARRGSSGAGVARAERLLAKLLDRAGDDAGAARATDRALVAAKHDPRQLAATVLDAVARAYVARDLAGARRAAKHAVGANLRDDEIVYAGLWLRLLEKELGKEADGTATALLGSIEQGAGWPGRLAAWSSGKLSDQELANQARTPSQRTESAFYRALARKAAGDAAGAEGGLREVVAAKTVDLMEAQIARDLLAGNDRRLPGPAPDVR